MKPKHFALFLFVLAVVSTANGRIFQSWTFEELLNASDLVAIIEPVSAEYVKDDYPGGLYGRALTDFQGINTTFKVHAVLKGHAETERPLIVRHFTYSQNVTLIFNGARFAHFIPGPLQFRKETLKDQEVVGGFTVYQEIPFWLAFLKKIDDGRFEAVTDPYDAVDSFRELHRSSFYIPLK
jgi:hypothetical protein